MCCKVHSQSIILILHYLTAHKEAFEKVKILHRDVSVSNILITNDGRGLLIDWDLSKHMEDLAKGAQQGEHSVNSFFRLHTFRL